MLNSIDIYRECGHRCAKARNQHDESRAKFESQWLGRALALEKPEDRQTARAAFDDAYHQARTVLRVSY